MTVLKPYYRELVDHYEQCFDQYGATPKGVDWPNSQDLQTRFTVMLDLCKDHDNPLPIKLLDLGCGYGALLDYLKSSALADKIDYKGIDLSEKMIEAAIMRHGSPYFETRDLLAEALPPETFDYIIMNGMFTEKRNLTQTQMEGFVADMLKTAYACCRKGLAFNVMNFHVDWFRDDLFHLPFDKMADMVMQHCSRHMTIRADYGLYEYTVYVYKRPNI